MYTLAVILSFLSVWCIFAASSKVEFNKTNLTLRLSQNTRVANLAACVFFIIATVLICNLQGTFVGIILSATIWMSLASLVLILAPFQKINVLHLAGFGLLCLLLELLLL